MGGNGKIYAIVESGGKQYKVSPGQTVEVERLGAAEGEKVSLERVLLIGTDDKVTVGTPVVEGAKVVATAQGEGKGKKVIVFKYKPKVRYSKKTGHRHIHTKLLIDEIVAPGVKAKEVAPKPKKTVRRKKEVKEDGA